VSEAAYSRRTPFVRGLYVPVTTLHKQTRSAGGKGGLMVAHTYVDAREAPAQRLGDDAMPEVIACPDPTCRAPAQIVDRWTFRSTDGPVEHVKTGCERGHWFTPTIDSLVLRQVAP
jgi:hypothetical protein